MTSKKKPAGNKEAPATTIPDFIQWVEELEGGLFLYRGLADASWEVETSALRRLEGSQKNPGNEISLESFQDYIEDRLQEARRRGYGYQDGTGLSDLELLAKLQHHGAATCLIDFTTDPLAALWFACDKPDRNGKVIAIRSDQPDKFNEITHEQLKAENIRELLSKENLYKWEPPTQVDNRILAQQSVFIFGESIIENKYYEEIEIAINSGKSLERYGITEQSLFPDFPGFALSNSHYKPYAELSAEDYMKLGVKFQQKGDTKKAIGQYSKAIRLQPKNAMAYNNRGYAKKLSKDHRGAIDDFDQSIRLDPQQIQPYKNRGDTKYASKNYQSALDDYNETIRLSPKYQYVYISRGNANFELKNHQEAMADYTKAIRLTPKYHYAHSARGDANFKLKNYREAMGDYTEAIRLNPQYHPAYFSRANVSYELKNYLEAINYYTEAIQLSPQNDGAYCNRGNAYLKLKNYHEAINDYTEATRINPLYAAAYNSRGIAKKELGDASGAKEDFEKSKELEKNRN